MTWRAIEVVRGEQPQVREFDDAALMPGDVTIDVAYSSLNYKDALALGGRPGIVAVDRLIAGIDLVGVVAASDSPDWSVGDRVLVNGGGLSGDHHGGLAQRARVPADWLVRVPDRFSLAQAAAVGTAGYTAQLAVLALESAEVDGTVLVTGASGGVGSIAISLLAASGFTVAALTGSPDHADVLRELGAAEIVDRAELEQPGPPMQSQRWGAAVDNAGGTILANVLAQLRYGGTVASCGNAASVELPTTVLPFILRAVTLAGINSVDTPRPLRLRAWERLDRDLDLAVLDGMTRTVGLHDAIAASDELLAGNGRGRIVVDVHG